MANEQRIVHFSGSVQGVGFRYTTCRVAGGYDVTGFVRNLRDGRVECIVEGDAAEIDAFLADLGERMSYYVRKHSQQEAPYTGQFPSFGVRY
jgi:acylphosphatase